MKFTEMLLYGAFPRDRLFCTIGFFADSFYQSQHKDQHAIITLEKQRHQANPSQ